MNGSESERLASSLVPSMSIVQVAKERKREGEREIKREGVEESKKEKEREKGKESIQYMLNKVFAETVRVHCQQYFPNWMTYKGETSSYH